MRDWIVITASIAIGGTVAYVLGQLAVAAIAVVLM